MWYSTSEHDEFGFEVLRPDENGDLEMIQCSAWFDTNRLVIEGPTCFHHLFEYIIKDAPTSYDFNGEYLIARYDGFYIQLKIEPGDGLVIDVWEDNDDAYSPISEATIWWDDF
jgi:hypothetical protein